MIKYKQISYADCILEKNHIRSRVVQNNFQRSSSISANDNNNSSFKDTVILVITNWEYANSSLVKILYYSKRLSNSLIEENNKNLVK